MSAGKTARIGVDIGGTFTDFVLHDETRGITRTGKRLTTPDDPSRAIIEGVARLLEETGTTAAQIHSIVHGTTLITNTVLERTGAKVGLIATQGFADTLEMARETRYDVDDLFQQPVPVIVPRNLRRGVPGRIMASGEEREPLDERAGCRDALHRPGVDHDARSLAGDGDDIFRAERRGADDHGFGHAPIPHRVDRPRQCSRASSVCDLRRRMHSMGMTSLHDEEEPLHGR